MVVTISATFEICWGTDITLHVLESVFSYKLTRDAFFTAHAMIMFNSAVNPFAYALVNQRFREKVKRMICCSWLSSSRSRVHAAREPQGIELDNATIQPTDTGGPY